MEDVIEGYDENIALQDQFYELNYQNESEKEI